MDSNSPTIASFQIDHRRLLRGLYISRVDKAGEEYITTFDIRMCRPYVDAVMPAAAIHTIEHIGATYLRNVSKLKDKVLYFGPMGCQTGFYLILHGNYLSSKEILPAVRSMFWHISTFAGKIPGATEEECGNCHLNDLGEARLLAFKYYMDFLADPKGEERFHYPEKEQV